MGQFPQGSTSYQHCRLNRCLRSDHFLHRPTRCRQKDMHSSISAGRKLGPTTASEPALHVSPRLARNLARNPWYGMEFSVKYGV